jgi:hypothetical protein
MSPKWAWWLVALVVLPLIRRFVGPRPGGRPGVDVEAVRSRVAAAREPAGIATRIAVVAVVACACAALLAAGVTALLLSPQWLGIALVVVAALLALAATPQVVRVRRTLRARRLRLHGHEVSQELDGTRPA